MGDVRFKVEARAGDGAPWLVAYPEWVCDACDGSGFADTASGARCPACRGSRKLTRMDVADPGLRAALARLRDRGDGEPVVLADLEGAFDTLAAMYGVGERMRETWLCRFVPACAALARRPTDVRFVFDVSTAEPSP